MWLWMLVACEGTRLVKDLTAEPGAVPGTVWVSWTSPKEGRGTVRYGKDGELTERVVSEPGTEHRVLLLSPQAGRTYTVLVDYETDSGRIRTSEAVEVKVDPPAQGSPNFTQVVWDPSRSCMDGGYILMSWLGDAASGVSILDREGEHVWAHRNDVPGASISRARLGRDGRSLLWTYADEGLRDDFAHIVHSSIDGETVTETRTELGHHDFVELPDGELAWLSYDMRDIDILDDAPDKGPQNVVVDRILVDGEAIFSFYDDVTTELYDISHRPGTRLGFLGPGRVDYSHGNSLVYDEDDDALMIMYRWLDAMQKIDRQTGEVLWTWGDIPGVADDFTGADADRFLHAHFSEAWGDQVLVFDNHDSHDSHDYSMLKQFTVDEGSGTFELTWQFDSDRHENLLGDVRRLPIEGCDNVLVSFSNQARIVELTREGDIVWEVAGDSGAVTSRVQFVPDLHDFGAVAYPR